VRMPLIAALLLFASTAIAGPFTHKTMQQPWPERKVQRQFVMPKGWLQIELVGDSKFSRSYWDDEAQRVRYDEGTTWNYSRLWLNVDQGFSKRMTLYLRIPFVTSQLVNPNGANITTRAFGDVHAGIISQPVLTDKWSVAGQLDLKTPSGMEWPGDFVGGPSNVENFLTGTGTTNLGLLIHLRYTFFDTLRLQLTGGYVLKFPAIVGYVIEPEGFGNGWLDPGDEIVAQTGLTMQLTDQISLSTTQRVSRRAPYRIGISGASVWRAEFEPIDDSAGLYVDGSIALSYEPNAHWEMGIEVSDTFYGTDSTLFAPLGLEEFSPQPGLVLGLRVAARW
jgi:hypothetical protein